MQFFIRNIYTGKFSQISNALLESEIPAKAQQACLP
jgi:hypothetical protein